MNQKQVKHVGIAAAVSESRTTGEPHADNTATSGERTEPADGAATYMPKVSNVFGHMNFGDYLPDDESQRVESAPLSTLKAFRCDESACDSDARAVDP